MYSSKLTAQTCTSGDIRLINGDTNNEGTIEICVTGVWGTICDDLWDNKEAQVACRQLGFQAEGIVSTPSFVSPSPIPSFSMLHTEVRFSCTCVERIGEPWG